MTAKLDKSQENAQVRTHSSALSTFLQRRNMGFEPTIEGRYGGGAYLTRFGLVRGDVSGTDTQMRR